MLDQEVKDPRKYYRSKMDMVGDEAL